MKINIILLHYHPNSVVSGVLYLDCDKDNDRIHFFSPLKYAHISPTYMKWRWRIIALELSFLVVCCKNRTTINVSINNNT